MIFFVSGGNHLQLGENKIIMAAEINSKKAVVSKAPYELYMVFVDMRNFLAMLPEDKKEGVEADYDYIHATVQGFNVGIKVSERVPYSRISFVDDGAPFNFQVDMHFDSVGVPDKTEFYINVNAELNFMMKTFLSPKIKDALDKVVDSLVAMSEGRMPEGVNPSDFPEGFDPEKYGFKVDS